MMRYVKIMQIQTCFPNAFIRVYIYLYIHTFICQHETYDMFKGTLVSLKRFKRISTTKISVLKIRIIEMNEKCFSTLKQS